MNSILYISLLFASIVGTLSADFETNPLFVGEKYADVAGARGLLLDEDNGDILVLARSSSQVRLSQILQNIRIFSKKT